MACGHYHCIDIIYYSSDVIMIVMTMVNCCIWTILLNTAFCLIDREGFLLVPYIHQWPSDDRPILCSYTMILSLCPWLLFVWPVGIRGALLWTIYLLFCTFPQWLLYPWPSYSGFPSSGVKYLLWKGFLDCVYWYPTWLCWRYGGWWYWLFPPHRVRVPLALGFSV